MKKRKRKRSLRRRNNQKNKEIVGGVSGIQLGTFMTFLATLSVASGLPFAPFAPLALGVVAANYVEEKELDVNPIELAEAAQVELEKKAAGEGEGEVYEVESEGEAGAEDEDELPDFNPGERIDELNGLVALTLAETQLVGSINDRCRQLTADPDNPRINVICNAWLSQIRLQMIGVMRELQQMEEEEDIAEMGKLMAGRTLPPEATKYLGDSSVSDTFSAAVVMLDGIIEETTTRETTQDRRLQEATGAAAAAPAAEAAEAAATEPLPLPQRCAMIEGGHFFGSSEAFEMACAEERKTKPTSECSIWTLPTAEKLSIAGGIFGFITTVVGCISTSRDRKKKATRAAATAVETKKHHETVEAHAKSTAAEIKGARQDNVEMFDQLKYEMDRHNKRLTREARRKKRGVHPDSQTAYPGDLTRMGSAPPPPPPPATSPLRRTTSTGSAVGLSLAELRGEKAGAAWAAAQAPAPAAVVRGKKPKKKGNKKGPKTVSSLPLTPPPTPSPRSATLRLGTKIPE